MKRCVILSLVLLCVALLCGCVEVSSGQGVEPGYSYDVTGHWELSRVLQVGPSEESYTDDDVSLHIEWGDDNKIVYTFEAADTDEKAVFTVEPYWFNEMYYTSSYVEPGINIVREAESDDAPGNVVCSLAIADVEGEDSAATFKMNVHAYFDGSWGEGSAERFSIDENMTQSTGYDGQKYFITPSAHLPEGTEDGEVIYIVLSTADEANPDACAYVAWEYSWVAEPETIVVPDRYGPVEYYASISPWQVYGLAALCILGLVAIIAAVVVLKHKRNKA